MQQPESNRNLPHRLKLLRDYRSRPGVIPEYGQQPAGNEGSFLSLNPRLKMVLVLLTALTIGNLPEFQVPGSARLNVFCSEVNGERVLTVDVTHLKGKIDRGAISLVYRQNPQRGSLVAIFPHENPSWRESRLDLPYHTPATSPHRESVGDTFSIHQGFVRPGDVDKNENVLDRIRVTRKCFERQQ